MISSTLLKKIESVDPNLREVLLAFVDEIEEKSKIVWVDRGDFNELKDIVKELADAQKRTEIKIEKLTEAQIQTEQELKSLTVTVKNMQRQIGGLSMEVGYGIEDKLMPYIFDFCKKEFGIQVKKVERKYIQYPNGKYDEINIYAEGIKDEKKFFIIGEAKAQPGIKDIDKFIQVLERLKAVLNGDIYPFFVGYQYDPEVEKYLKNNHSHILMLKTYEFEMKYRKVSVD